MVSHTSLLAELTRSVNKGGDDVDIIDRVSIKTMTPIRVVKQIYIENYKKNKKEVS